MRSLVIAEGLSQRGDGLADIPCKHVPTLGTNEFAFAYVLGTEYRTMNRKITGFHTDAENHWVAELECGHGQHMRHDPPWMERPWVTTEEGRQSRLGEQLNCVRCDELARGISQKVIDECRASDRGL